MKVILTENQLNTLILEYHDRNKPYVRTHIFKALEGSPGYIKSYLKGLPRFYMRDEQGNPHTDNEGKKIIYTTIPEIIYDYIHGNF
jgi:hypothetical protein